MNEREEAIVEYVKHHSFATPMELAEVMKVSSVTIRRDINKLDKENILSKVHGGVIFQKPAEPKSVDFRKSQYVEEKRRLARYIAAHVVKPGEKIFLDAGSTTYYIAEELMKLEHLTIITHSLSIINLVKDNEKNYLIAIGGEYNKRLQACIGPLVEEAYLSLRADRAFLAANAINLSIGCYDNTGSEKHIKNIMNRNAENSYLILNSSKFYNHSGLFLSIKKKDIKNIITTLPRNCEKLCEEDMSDINFFHVP